MIAILVFGLIVLSAICLWLLIEGRKSPKFLIWFIPLLLIVVSSTYETYTSILGFPRVSTPQKGLYLKHFIDEPNWIYLWVLGNGNVPMSYQIIYSRESHNSLEGVSSKAEEGKFMVLGEEESEEDGNEEGEEGWVQSNESPIPTSEAVRRKFGEICVADRYAGQKTYD